MLYCLVFFLDMDVLYSLTYVLYFIHQFIKIFQEVSLFCSAIFQLFFSSMDHTDGTSSGSIHYFVGHG
jgi:hypothetical protein